MGSVRVRCRAASPITVSTSPRRSLLDPGAGPCPWFARHRWRGTPRMVTFTLKQMSRRVDPLGVTNQQRLTTGKFRVTR
ncbi:hypothetical protein FM103_11130 [Corynebacterium xerosis]|nr:hypothetical protein FM103_11130 [Corynebacterium xerosis]